MPLKKALTVQYNQIIEHVQPLLMEVESIVKKDIPSSLPFREFRIELTPPTVADLHEFVTKMAEVISLEGPKETKVKVDRSCRVKWISWMQFFGRLIFFKSEIDEDAFTKIWCNEAERLAKSLVENAEPMAKEVFSVAAREARAELQRYCNLLLNTIKSARTTHLRGKEATLQKIKELENDSKLVGEFVDSIARIKQQNSGAYQSVDTYNANNNNNEKPNSTPSTSNN